MTIQDELKDIHTKPTNLVIPNITDIEEPVIETKNKYNLKYFEYTYENLIFEITEKYGEKNIRIFDGLSDKNFPQVIQNIISKDIFSLKTRKDIINAFKINKLHNEEASNKIIDKLYSKYQIWLNLKKQDEGSKKEFEDLRKKSDLEKLLKQKEEAKIKFEAERPKDILDIIQSWDKLFRTYSNNNPEYSRISLHLLIGQCIINSRMERLGLNLDPRISIMYFKPSGTGGSSGFNIVADVADALQLKCNVVASATDAAMIGSVDEEDNETGEKEVVQIKGLLDRSKSNIIYWQEPEGLFEKNQNQHEGNIRRYIQSGLNLIEDRESKLNRDMKYGQVIAECEASIILATVKPQSISDKVIDSGFMQRFCFINKVIDIQERALNAMWDNSNLTTIDEEGNINRKQKIYQNQLKEDIIKKLMYLKQWGEYNKEFFVRINAIKYFNIQETLYFNQIKTLKNSTERVKEKLAMFQQFTVRKGWQIAMHRAALRFSNIVEKEDIEYAATQIIEPQMKSMLNYLEESWINEIVEKKEESNKDKFTNAFLQYMGTNEITKIPKKEVLQLIMKIFRKEQATAYNYYKSFINQEKIIEDKEGNVTLDGIEAKKCD